MEVQSTTGAVNLNSDGTIKDATLAQITASKIDVGVYQIFNVTSLASIGWTTTIKEDVNGDKTISLAAETNDSGVLVRTYERGTTTPLDIVDCLTLRFDLDVTVSDEVAA